MKIAISQRVIDFRNGPYDALDHGFYSWFADHDIITIPNNIDFFRSSMILEADLVVFSGGNSMVQGDWQFSVDRIKVEKHMLDLALMYDKRILGVSRGTQFLTLAFGGTIDAMEGHHKNHTVKYRKVKVDVCSRHNEVLTSIPSGANIIAQDENGYCESWTLDNVSTVLWHPERMDDHWIPKEIKDRCGL